MVDSRSQKYGPFKSSVIEMIVGASEVFKHLGGGFVKMDDSGRIEIADDSDLDIVGWATTHEQTASSTEGLTTVGVETNLQKLFKIPANNHATVVTAATEAQLKAAIGESFDITVISDIQYADLATSTYNTLIGYGYEYYGTGTNMQAMVVKVNPAVVAYTSH